MVVCHLPKDSCNFSYKVGRTRLLGISYHGEVHGVLHLSGYNQFSVFFTSSTPLRFSRSDTFLFCFGNWQTACLNRNTLWCWGYCPWVSTLYIQGKFGGGTQRYSFASSNSGSSSLDSPESARETSVECKSFKILHFDSISVRYQFFITFKAQT